MTFLSKPVISGMSSIPEPLAFIFLPLVFHGRIMVVSLAKIQGFSRMSMPFLCFLRTSSLEFRIIYDKNRHFFPRYQKKDYLCGSKYWQNGIGLCQET